MEIHRQQCQACRGYRVHNVLVREANLPTVIYVACADCGALVARYELSGYYHHGRGIESFLRSRMATVEESGRQMIQEFEQAKTTAVDGFMKAMEELKRQGKEL